MIEIVKKMAGLTSYRQRELLDVALAEAMMEAIKPNKITFVTLVTNGNDHRLLERAVFEKDVDPVLEDIMWAVFQKLPELKNAPHRQECFEKNTTVTYTESSNLVHTFLPIKGEHGVESLIELETSAPLDESLIMVIQSMQYVYVNMHALLDYSERDSLTGLMNRKSFEDAFYKALNATPLHGKEASAYTSQRLNATLSDQYWVGMLDIDFFKKVNDTYGHLIGDDVLVSVSTLLKSNFRFHDRLYRFGGEEFVVLMRCANKDDAFNAFERFRTKLQDYIFPQVGNVTISMGICKLELDDTPTKALKRADDALYFAKGNGRNQVCCFEDLDKER